MTSMTSSGDGTAATPRDDAAWLSAADEVGERAGRRASAADADGRLDPRSFEAARDAGITAALVPVEFGGGGASHAQMGAVLRRLAANDPALGVTLAMHSHTVAAQVWRHNHGQDATKVLAAVAGGAVLVTSGASDWTGSSGRARRVEGGYVVSARKSPISGCEIGQVLATTIRWDDSPDGPAVLHCTVPMAGDGVSIQETWDTLGLRATGSHTVVLDEVFVADGAVALVRPADRWHPIWNVVLGSAVPLIMSAYLGIVDAAVSIAVDTVGDELSAERSLGEMIAASLSAADAVAAMFVDADNLRFDNSDAFAGRTVARKTTAVDASILAVRTAMEAVGGRAYGRGGDLERLYRDVHGCMFHPLPRAQQAPFTGRTASGRSPIP